MKIKKSELLEQVAFALDDYFILESITIHPDKIRIIFKNGQSFEITFKE